MWQRQPETPGRRVRRAHRDCARLSTGPDAFRRGSLCRGGAGASHPRPPRHDECLACAFRPQHVHPAGACGVAGLRAGLRDPSCARFAGRSGPLRRALDNRGSSVLCPKADRHFRHSICRGDQEGDLHRDELAAAGERHIADALFRQYRAGRRHGPVFRPFRHRQDDFVVRSGAPAHRRRRARLGRRRAFSISRAAATPRSSICRREAEPEIWAASHRFGTVLENVPVDAKCANSTSTTIR